MIGPPRERSGCRISLKRTVPSPALLPFQDSGVKMTPNDPLTWSVPDLVDTLITAPEPSGTDASTAAVLTCASPMASVFIVSRRSARFCLKDPMSAPSSWITWFSSSPPRTM